MTPYHTDANLWETLPCYDKNKSFVNVLSG